jgi:ribosomal protein RSM22 (predicted rRNA methylase)
MSERLDVLLRIIFDRLFSRGIDRAPPNVLANSKLDEISRAVARLSELYTRNRAGLRHDLLQEPDLRLAYLAYFLPSNLLKIKAVLDEIWLHPKVETLFPECLRILDLGCGPGTLLLGCMDFLSQQVKPPEKIECVGVDSVESNLQDARYLFDRLAAELYANTGQTDPTLERVALSKAPPLVESQRDRTRFSLETYRSDVSRPLKLRDASPFDFIIMGNVLNELFSGDEQRIEKRSRRIATLIQDWLAPNGFVILMEPALRETSRDLLHLRDRLLDMLPLTVYSPCVHSHPCPAVAPGCTSDWCHEDHAWETPSWIRRIDERTGLRKSSLKFSYVVFNRMGLSIRDAALGVTPSDASTLPVQNQLWRVVSETLEERGKAAAYLCGFEGRFRVTRLNKHASPLNADFASLDRGQVVSTGPLATKSVTDRRVQAETPLRILTGKRKSC